MSLIFGRFGTEKGGNCTTCQENTYQDGKGHIECKYCKDGRLPNEKQTACEIKINIVNNGLKIVTIPAAIWPLVPCPKGMTGIAHKKAPHQMRISPK